ncbi:MAG: hypothetical protein K2J30_02690, partial [Clostridia bacterium]|nr:hypothetical protein [Clostridia bacterium]
MKKLLGAALALALGVTCVGALAACDNGKDDNPGVSDADAAKTAISAIKQMYIDKYVNTSTNVDYTLIGQYPVNGTYCPITWTVNITSEGVTEGVAVTAMDTATKLVTIDVNEKTTADIEYELTASITYNGVTETYTFKGLKVPKYDLNSHADYTSATKGDKLRVTGTVIGLEKKEAGATHNTIVCEDSDGGYYAYSLTAAALPDGLAIGKQVTVSGTYDLYNGLHELKDCTVEMIEDGTAVTPTDITDLMKAAKDNKDETIVAMQSQLVTIKDVTLYDVSATNATYYGFKLGKVETYLRISTSDCPTNKANQDKIVADHAANLGKKATVTGIVTVYGGAFYIVPVSGDAFKDFAEDTTPPADKVAAEKAAVKLTDKVSSSGDVTLPKPSTYQDVKFTWESANKDIIVISEDNTKMTVTVPAKPTEVEVTLTIKCGEVTEEKKFTVTVGSLGLAHAGTAADPHSTADAAKIFASLGDTETYQESGADKQVYIQGYVTDAGEINANKNDATQTYGLKNVYIADVAGTAKADSVVVYNINWGEAMEKADANPLQVGDFVVVKGFVKTYKGTKEIADGMVDGTKTYAVITAITKAADVKKGDT